MPARGLYAMELAVSDCSACSCSTGSSVSPVFGLSFFATRRANFSRCFSTRANSFWRFWKELPDLPAILKFDAASPGFVSAVGLDNANLLIRNAMDLTIEKLVYGGEG